MKKDNFRAPLLFFVISAILIFSWFRYGYLYGGGDVGLQTYNPQRIMENAKYMWWDSAGPGAVLPQGLSAILFQGSLFILQLFGLGPVAMQAALFFVLLFLMGFGMYLFASEIFGAQKKYAVLAGLFYMFNPYMMIQVWHRFIHTAIILAAVLPFLAIFWHRWIRNGSFKDFLLFLLTSVFSVYAFGTYAFIPVVWIFLSFLTFNSLIPWQGKKHLSNIALKFLFGFIVWILINSWWMIPVAKISPAVLSQQHKTEESLMTLITISSQEILPYSLQLINPFYLVNQADFGTFYSHLTVRLIPWIFVSLILVGLIVSLKQKAFSLFGIFYLLTLFLAKGGSPPFGNAYIFGFTNIFALGVLRNPFEKSGLILVFFSTLLFILGLSFVSEKFAKYKVLIFTFVCFLIILYSWPMFLGKVIGKIDKPAFVQVPQTYKEADKWFLDRKKEGITDGKILHLPLSRQESIQYNWNLGYNGLEPSDTFFTAYPSISRAFNVKRIDDALSGLGMSFLNTYSDPPKILSALSDFNIRFLVLHKDVNFAASGLENPDELEKVLNQLDFLEQKVQFGDLIVYQLKDRFFKPQISFEYDVDLLYPGNENLSFWPGVIKSPDTKFATPLDNMAFDQKNTFVFPSASFIYGNSSESISSIDRLKSAESFFKQTGMIQSLDLAGKIVNLSLHLNNAEEYKKGLKEIFPQKIEINKFQITGQESLLSSIFRQHLMTLAALGMQDNKSELEKYLIESDLKPEFFDDDLGERQIFRFKVPKEDPYRILMTDAETSSLYEGNLSSLSFYVNNGRSKAPGKVTDTVLDFGTFIFEAGEAEVSYPLILSKNLAGAINTRQGYMEIPLTSTSGSSLYRLSGEVTGVSSGFYILLFEDQNTFPSMKQFLQVLSSGVNQKFLVNFLTKPITKTAKIILSADDSAPGITFSNLSISRVLNNMIFLAKTTEDQNSQYQDESVEFNKKSPIEYKGRFKIANPGFIFFRETYHPGWKLKIKNENGSYNITEHYLGSLYANAWYIDKTGDYDFKIYFEPQNNFLFGLILTGVGILLVGGYGLLKRRLKTKNV